MPHHPQRMRMANSFTFYGCLCSHQGITSQIRSTRVQRQCHTLIKRAHITRQTIKQSIVRQISMPLCSKAQSQRVMLCRIYAKVQSPAIKHRHITSFPIVRLSEQSQLRLGPGIKQGGRALQALCSRHNPRRSLKPRMLARQSQAQSICGGLLRHLIGQHVTVQHQVYRLLSLISLHKESLSRPNAHGITHQLSISQHGGIVSITIVKLHTFYDRSIALEQTSHIDITLKRIPTKKNVPAFSPERCNVNGTLPLYTWRCCVFSPPPT